MALPRLATFVVVTFELDEDAELIRDLAMEKRMMSNRKARKAKNAPIDANQVEIMVVESSRR